MNQLSLYLIILIIPMTAQIYVSYIYKKSKEIPITKEKTGFDVARLILDKNGLSNMYIVETKGVMSDHYDSKQKVVRLSSDVFHGKSIAAVSIAAHEVGHAIQDKENFLFMRIRSMIFPIVSLGTKFSYIVIFIGIFMQSMNLIMLGILLVSLGLLFQVITLPVEIDASKRAIRQLNDNKLINKDEVKYTKNMLNAAALTYIAGVLASMLEIIRLLLLTGDGD